MDIKFRIATGKDVPDIVNLCNECFNESTDISKAKKIFARTRFDKNQIYLVGELDGKIVAHTKITIIPTIYDEMSTYAIINHVCVKPDYRRLHIGTKLLDEIFRICKKHKCKDVKLWSKNFRIAAHAMYQKYGFNIIDAKFFEKNI